VEGMGVRSAGVFSGLIRDTISMNWEKLESFWNHVQCTSSYSNSSTRHKMEPVE
jgi:hypothetical protein